MGWVTEGLDRSDYDRTYKDGELFRRIASYFSPYRYLILLLSIAITFDAFANAFIPVVLAGLVESLSEGNGDLGSFVLIVGVFFVLSFLMIAIREIITAMAVQGAVRDLRKDAFGALIRRDFSFFDNQPSGRLASRVTNDTAEFGTTVTLTANLISQIFSIGFIMYFLATRSLKLTLLISIFIPIITIIALSYRRIARRVSLASQRVIAKVNALIQETTAGIYVAKSFRAENRVYDEFEGMNRQNFRTSLFRQLVFISIFPALTMVTALGTASVVYLGGMDLIGAPYPFSNFVNALPGEQLTVADWFLFIQGINFFFFPVIQIASFWSQFQLGLAASERIFSIIDSETEVVQHDSKIIEDMQGEIEFRDLTFGYNEEQLVLKDFSLHIRAGEKIAVVGHTGAGKSTLGKLIARYYEFSGGRLLIDGHDIRSLDLASYRRHLSIIAQEVFLWNGTLRENLLYGMEDAPDLNERLEEVLQKVGVFDWIASMDGGLEASIGERGGSLSMGQRQLIAFARILLRDPKILIMDEATASVDPLTEVRIQRATNLMLEGRTSIIIAHRLSTIRHVDRIIVMKEGRIIEEGSHRELLGKGGHYRELYDTYFHHQSLEYVESLSRDS